MTVTAVIVAGGSGERFGSQGGKQLAMLAGRPVLAWSVAAFEASDLVGAIVVVAHPERVAEYGEAARSGKLSAVVGGGKTRQLSVAAGLAAASEDSDVIAVHDGARPLVTSATIDGAVRALQGRPDIAGVVVGHPQFDTVKRVGDDDEVLETVDRRDLWIAQTPQVFRASGLLDAYRRAEEEGFAGTDDASLVERAGGKVMMLSGPRENIKVTVPEDLVVAEAVLQARMRGPAR